MGQTARVFEHNDIGIAWSFVLECEDESPRSFGVDLLPAFPTRRDGIFRQRSHADATVPWFDESARAYEDDLIARLDGEVASEVDEFEDEREETFAPIDSEEEVEVFDDLACSPEPEDIADRSESLPLREGLGRRARRLPVVSLRRV